MEPKDLDRDMDELRAEAQRHKGRSRRRRALRILATVVLAIFVVAAVGVGAFSAVKAMGARKLKDKSADAKLSMTIEDPEGEGTASGRPGDPDPEGDPYRWEEGWVRYQGEVYEYNEDIMTFLVMGIDKDSQVRESRGKTDGGQADALFLVILNPDDQGIRILAINRDTMTDIEMYGYGQTAHAQIANQHGFGDGKELSCELTVKAVSRLLYDLPIHGYAAINMSAIPKLNDAVGGVTVTVPEDLAWINRGWTRGAEVTLKGQDAYDYVHYRDINEFESARGRLARQKAYLTEFINNARAAVKKDITLPLTLYGELSKYMVTDVTVDELAYLAGEVLDYHLEGDPVYTMEGTTRMGEKHEEFYPDEEALKGLMIELFYQPVEPD